MHGNSTAAVRGSGGSRAAPGPEAIVRLTRACNQRCLFCCTWETADDLYPAPAEVFAALDRLGAEGREVTVSGGEPTIAPRFFEYLAYGARRGVPAYVIQTNAVAFADPDFRARLRAIEAELHFFVSLHSRRAAVSDDLTEDPGGHARTLAGLRGLIDDGYRVEVNHVLTTLNYRELPDFVDWLRAEFPAVPVLHLSFTAANNRALEHRWVIPRLAWVRPFVVAALARAAASGWAVRHPDRCGLPPCGRVETGASSHPLPQRSGGRPLTCDGETVPGTRSHDHVKAPACSTCAADAECVGVWKEYARQYGTRELAPLTHEQWSGIGGRL